MYTSINALVNSSTGHVSFNTAEQALAMPVLLYVVIIFGIGIDIISLLLLIAGVFLLLGRQAGRWLFMVACFFEAFISAQLLIALFHQSGQPYTFTLILPFLIVMAYWIVGAIFVYLPKSQAYFQEREKNEVKA